MAEAFARVEEESEVDIPRVIEDDMEETEEDETGGMDESLPCSMLYVENEHGEMISDQSESAQVYVTTEAVIPVPETNTYCNMVYVLPSMYALDEPISSEVFLNMSEDETGVESSVRREELAVKKDKEDMDPDLRRKYVLFSKPTFAMRQHLRPLYVSADMMDKRVSRILVDTGAAVSVLTVQTMNFLQVPKEKILDSKMKVKSFAGNIAQTLGVVILKIRVGPSEMYQTFFVAECTAPYTMILGRDWLHQAGCVPSSLHQELAIWNPETDESEIIKADPRPFSVAACFVDASYYSEDMRPLRVSGITKKGHPYGVTSTELTQWGLAQLQADASRPISMVLPRNNQ